MTWRTAPRNPYLHPLREIVRDTRGASYVEYFVLAGVIALLSIQAFTGFAGKVDTTMNEQAIDPAKMGL